MKKLLFILLILFSYCYGDIYPIYVFNKVYDPYDRQTIIIGYQIDDVTTGYELYKGQITLDPNQVKEVRQLDLSRYAFCINSLNVNGNLFSFACNNSTSTGYVPNTCDLTDGFQNRPKKTNALVFQSIKDEYGIQSYFCTRESLMAQYPQQGNN